MTLPFPTDNNRKFQCFCCGLEFTDYSEFKSHIIENHEEGREYVICPLNHCKAPVRDLKTHCKVKHPNFNTKNIKGQNKAIIWYDFTQKGKKKTKKPAFKQGKYQSIKTGKILPYRSGMEEKVYKLLDQYDDVMTFDYEPFKINYIHKGQRHLYIPDIFVTFLDGHKELWEVKPSNQTSLEVNQNKWYAAKEACDLRGWKFEVYTETMISSLERKIRNQIID
jgi:hypothetical protein